MSNVDMLALVVNSLTRCNPVSFSTYMFLFGIHIQYMIYRYLFRSEVIGVHAIFSSKHDKYILDYTAYATDSCVQLLYLTTCDTFFFFSLSIKNLLKNTHTHQIALHLICDVELSS